MDERIVEYEDGLRREGALQVRDWLLRWGEDDSAMKAAIEINSLMATTIVRASRSFAECIDNGEYLQ